MLRIWRDSAPQHMSAATALDLLRSAPLQIAANVSNLSTCSISTKCGNDNTHRRSQHPTPGQSAHRLAYGPPGFLGPGGAPLPDLPITLGSSISPNGAERWSNTNMGRWRRAFLACFPSSQRSRSPGSDCAGACFKSQRRWGLLCCVLRLLVF